jgi:hypothetical protein
MSITTQVLLICAFLTLALVFGPALGGTPLSTIAAAFFG